MESNKRSEMSHMKTTDQSARNPSGRMYLDQSTADIHFMFKTNGVALLRIPAHRSVLVATSKVFEEKISERPKGDDDIVISDMSPADFAVFLQFVYHKKINPTEENVATVMYLGQKYAVVDCLRACEAFLIDNLSVENVCWSYGLALRFDQTTLTQMCEATIGINIKSIFKSPRFLQCDRKVLSHIMRLNSLSCSEFELFTACESWLKHMTHKSVLTSELIRSYLGQSIRDIRFHLMALTEFISIYSSYETLFTPDNRRYIVQTITAKEFDKNPESRKIRSRSWMNVPVFECERAIDKTNEPYFIDCLESTIFSTNQTVLLRAICCAAILKYDVRSNPFPFKPIWRDFPGQIEIVEYSTRGTFRTVYKDDYVDLECYKDDEEYGIWLNRPIIIKATNKYEIRLIPFLGDYSCTNIKLTSSSVRTTDGFVIDFHDGGSGSSSDTEENRGLIYGLTFSHL